MDTATLGFALSAGLVAAVNPCGFAMLPAYLALVVLGEGTERGQATAMARALAATAAMTFGFLLVFGTFGLVVAPLASQVQQYLPAVTVVIGAALIGLGVWLVSGRELTVLLPKFASGAPTARLGSMLGYGVAYAIASLSCTIGPFLAVTGTTFQSGSALLGVLAFLAYGTGMALVVGVLAIAVAVAGASAVTRMRRVLPYINRVSGALLIVVGGYVGYYGFYELRLFHGDADPSDPVVDAAGAIQQTLVRWVDTIGPLPLLAALAGLIGLAVLLGYLRSRRRART
ncbi:cytochrome c biogenesis CcdA family protein [Haloechinothrix salitolerans]|uniref:Cytochrome c biogenesis CcdA family protein n=1 Tax=Haloechinothrix salitolerans TaxID=926830 RepID=A0ABW2C793_9PSEU